MKLGGNPDLVHAITAPLALRTQAICLEHGSTHQEGLAGLQVFGWTVVRTSHSEFGTDQDPAVRTT